LFLIFSATKTNVWPSEELHKKNDSQLVNSLNLLPYIQGNRHLSSSKTGLIRVRGVGVRNRNDTIQQQILKRQLFFRQYYPEGEWGYIILFCAFLSQIICQGVLWSIGLISLAAERKFFRRFVPDVYQNYAGKFIYFKHSIIYLWNLLKILVANRLSIKHTNFSNKIRKYRIFYSI
jgi:hypothetical protein